MQDFFHIPWLEAIFEPLLPPLRAATTSLPWYLCDRPRPEDMQSLNASAPAAGHGGFMRWSRWLLRWLIICVGCLVVHMVIHMVIHMVVHMMINGAWCQHNDSLTKVRVYHWFHWTIGFQHLKMTWNRMELPTKGTWKTHFLWKWIWELVKVVVQ